jgi:hypothetical protein
MYISASIDVINVTGIFIFNIYIQCSVLVMRCRVITCSDNNSVNGYIFMDV